MIAAKKKWACIFLKEPHSFRGPTSTFLCLKVEAWYFFNCHLPPHTNYSSTDKNWPPKATANIFDFVVVAHTVDYGLKGLDRINKLTPNFRSELIQNNHETMQGRPEGVSGIIWNTTETGERVEMQILDILRLSRNCKSWFSLICLKYQYKSILVSCNCTF